MTLLDPGFNLTLRPMKYPGHYDRYQDSIKNTWTVQEISFTEDKKDLAKLTEPQTHLIKRLVAFFATGDTIVANNLVLNLYKHINAPESRMYLSRQLAEEALHVEFYLTLLDEYIPDHDERARMFDAVENIPSIARKAEFCQKYIDSLLATTELSTDDDKRAFLRVLICFACCIEGLFFYGAFAYVYWLRSKGLLKGLAVGTNYVFKDEVCHMNFAFDVINVVRKENPELWDSSLEDDIRAMLREALECEYAFAEDVLSGGIQGFSLKSMREFLEFTVDQRLGDLRMSPMFGTKNPLPWMSLQDIRETTNFFEQRPTAYQVGVGGSFSMDAEF